MRHLFDPEQWVNALAHANEEFLTAVAAFLPQFLGAFAILLIGWGVAKMLRRITKKFLNWTGISATLDRDELSELLKKAGIAGSISALLPALVFWGTVLLFLVSATETLGWSVLSNTLRDLFAYIPHVVGAIAILVLTILVSKPVYALVSALFSQLNLPFKDTLARFAAGVVIFLGVIVATTQLGIDLSFLTANIHLLVAGIIAFLAISLGLGSRTIAANLLAGFYTKQIFETGQEVFIANQKAKVKSVNDVCVIFTTEKGELVVPNERLMSKA